MQVASIAVAEYVAETRDLEKIGTSTEPTFYPAIKNLISEVLKEGRLPFQVRVNTSESRNRSRDMPDFVIGDDGAFVAVFGEVKRPNERLDEIAFSTDQDDQI